MGNNYNKIAKYYDFISRTVYGQYLVKAQVCLLQFIGYNSSILIIGGGTGWILEELAKLQSEGLNITYVDVSSEMIALAQKRDAGNNKVRFVNQSIEAYSDEKKYDVIITPFFFDNFREEKIRIVFSKLHAMLQNGGIWLYADFVNEKNKGPLWQKILLKTMYLFFRITCNIEASDLIDMKPFFAEHYQEIFEAKFYSGFIQAVAYKKNE